MIASNGLFGVTGSESKDTVDGAERPVAWQSRKVDEHNERLYSKAGLLARPERKDLMALICNQFFPHP